MSIVPITPSPPSTSLSFYTPSHSPNDIRFLYEERKQSYGEDLERMRHVQTVMDGEIVLPLPELSRNEAPAVANLALQGMSQMGRRIASVLPSIYFPNLDPSLKREATYARDRRRVVLGWHKDNRLKSILGKRARYFLAYACSPIVIKPDRRTGLPCWEVLDPLHTFPSELSWDELEPIDCVVDTQHTYRWLLDNYPEQIAQATKPSGWDYDNDVHNYDTMFTVLEYWDRDETLLVLLGADRPENYFGPSTPLTPNSVFLEAAPNLSGICPVVSPGSISLSKQKGHFDEIIGMYQTHATLMALTLIAQRRAVWPREWLVARQNETPEVVSVPDPYSGRPGELKGGELLPQTLDPSFRALEVMDRLEYAQRMTAGLPSEFGGQSPTNVRTAKRGAQVIGSTIDFTIAEAQDIFAESIAAENCRAIAIDKAYFNRPKTYLVKTRSFAGKVSYTPSALWTSDAHVVDYPIAGTDLQNLPIEGGQRVAMGTLSRQSFMELDPVVPDAEAEVQRITREGIRTAFLSSIQRLAGQPVGPYQPAHLARLDEMVANGMELYEAVQKLQTEIQKEQATQAPPTPEGQPAAPEGQPGLSIPGQGVEQPSMPAPDTSMQNMSQLLGQLGTVQTAQRYR